MFLKLPCTPEDLNMADLLLTKKNQFQVELWNSRYGILMLVLGFGSILISAKSRHLDECDP